MSELSLENGTVKADGVEINILQVPYLNGDCYESIGMTDAQIKAAGGLENISLPSDAYYQLNWDIVDLDYEDEADACAWDDVYATLCH